MIHPMNCAVEIPWISHWMISGKFLLRLLAPPSTLSRHLGRKYGDIHRLRGRERIAKPLWDKGSHHSFSSSSHMERTFSPNRTDRRP
jgi:hypothetical protein